MVIATDPARLDLDTVHRWLAATYWSPNIRRDVVERAFANSVAAGAYDETGRQVGVARVATDRATFAWLCDVYVDPEVRGRGIATRLVRTLLDHPELRTVRRWMLATRDAHDVYRPLGFGSLEASRFLELLPPVTRWT